jgi:hypothetical protein
MSGHQTSSRQLKKKIQQLLLQKNFKSGLAEIGGMPARKAINPLFSFLCSPDELLKWRAVTAMGKIVDRLAEADMESARVIMRRYMWQLNDESGGIGWGCLEHEVLQRGALWGVGRLAHARPPLLKTSVDYLHPYMQADDPHLRGLAAWAAGALQNKKTAVILNQLRDDNAKLNVYLDGHIIGRSVGEISKTALQMEKNE